MAVVPEATSPEVVEALKNAGLDVRTYNATGSEEQQRESRRIAVMDAVGMRNDILFHIEEENEDNVMYRRSTPAINKVNRQFNEELKSLNDKSVLLLGNPSSVLVSAGIKNNPMKLYGTKLIAKAKKHGYAPEDIKDLPLAVASPLAVFTGSRPNSFAILTVLKIRGNNVLVSISPSADVNDVDFNIISSIYDKKAKGILYWINEHKGLYYDKEKALTYLRHSAPIAETSKQQELDSAAKIVNSFENPKLSEEKIREAYPEFSKAGDDAEQEKMYRHITPAEDEANKKYNRQLEKYAQGKMSSGIMFELGEPSPILRICGITGKTIKMRQSVLNEHQKKHELTFDDLKNIPSALYHPIMVYQWGDKARSHVIITELPTHDGRRVTVTIRVNNTGHALDVEKITSVHGKDLEHLVKEINTEKSDFGKDNLKYVDKKKALSWLTVGPPKGPRITSEGLNSAAKIINDFDSTKYFEEKISELFPEYVSAASDASELIGGEKVRFEVVAPEEGTLGWYDPNDNSVHVVIPNHSNAEEVKRTVFHEKLGHEGLVSLLGSQEEVNKFGQYIFKSASKELRRKMLGKADDEGYGWDDPLRFSKAAQEVFADIAADGPKTAEEFSLWTKVKHYLIKGVVIS